LRGYPGNNRCLELHLLLLFYLVLLTYGLLFIKDIHQLYFLTLYLFKFAWFLFLELEDLEVYVCIQFLFCLQHTLLCLENSLGDCGISLFLRYGFKQFIGLMCLLVTRELEKLLFFLYH